MRLKSTVMRLAFLDVRFAHGERKKAKDEPIEAAMREAIKLSDPCSRLLPVDTELVAIPNDSDREIEEVNAHITYLHNENHEGLLHF